MAFIPVPNTVLVELLYSQESQLLENTLYFEHAGELAVSDMEDLAGMLVDWVSDNIMTELSVLLKFRGVKLTDLTLIDSPTVELSVTPVVPGLDSAVALTNNATLCIQFKTVGRGRSSRGRNYVSGLTHESRNTQNTVSTAFADSLITAYSLLLSETTIGEGWEWVVVSRFHDGVARSIGLTTPVSAVGVADYDIDSQKRRLLGRGS